jgi:hypothetical protein
MIRNSPGRYCARRFGNMLKAGRGYFSDFDPFGDLDLIFGASAFLQDRIATQSILAWLRGWHIPEGQISTYERGSSHFGCVPTHRTRAITLGLILVLAHHAASSPQR